MKTKWPGEVAAFHARTLMELLRPFCERIEIAGSLRRQKAEVGDIELLMIPKFAPPRIPGGDMFENPDVDKADEMINLWLADNFVAKRMTNAAPPPRPAGWGPKNKLAIHTASLIPVDFFATTPENWWVSLVIRTGSKDTNLRLTTGAQARGATLNAYGSGVTWSDGTSTPATSEEHVFEMCCVPYLKPEDRNY